MQSPNHYYHYPHHPYLAYPPAAVAATAPATAAPAVAATAGPDAAPFLAPRMTRGRPRKPPPLPSVKKVLPVFVKHVENFHRQRAQLDPLMNDPALRPSVLAAAEATATLESARVNAMVKHWWSQLQQEPPKQEKQQAQEQQQQEGQEQTQEEPAQPKPKVTWRHKKRAEQQQLATIYGDLARLPPYYCDPVLLFRAQEHDKEQEDPQKESATGAAAAPTQGRKRKGKASRITPKSASAALRIEADAIVAEALAAKAAAAKAAATDGDSDDDDDESSAGVEHEDDDNDNDDENSASSSSGGASSSSQPNKKKAKASSQSKKDGNSTSGPKRRTTMKLPERPVPLPIEGHEDGRVNPEFAAQLVEALEQGVRQDRARGWRARDLGVGVENRHQSRPVHFKALALRDYYALRQYVADDDDRQAALAAEGLVGTVPLRYQPRGENGNFLKRKKQYHPHSTAYLAYAWDVGGNVLRMWDKQAQTRREGLGRKERKFASLLGQAAVAVAAAGQGTNNEAVAMPLIVDSVFDPKAVYIKNHVNEMRRAFQESGGMVGASTTVDEEEDNGDEDGKGGDSDDNDEDRDRSGGRDTGSGDATSGPVKILPGLVAEWKADANVHWTLKMSDDEKKVWIDKAEKLKAELPIVRERVLELVEENPNYSNRDLAAKAGSAATNGSTVYRWLSRMDTCPYTSRRLPPLRSVQKQRHLDYCRQLLGNNNWAATTESPASPSAPQKVLLVHFDDKCFFTTPPTTTASLLRASTCRCENFGLEKFRHELYHVNEGKGKPLSRITVMSFVAIAYEGSVENGGSGIKLGMLRTQKSVPNEGAGGRGSRDSEELVDCMLSGSGSETSDGKPTFSLKDLFESTVFPAVADLVLAGGQYEGYRPVFQGDCVGPNGDETFVEYARSECIRRGWVWEPHPYQMPHANANSIGIFPHMMQQHDALLARYGNGKVRPQLDEMWQTCLDAYEAIDVSAVARSFVSARRIAEQVVEHGGDNAFLASEDQPSRIEQCRNDFKDTVFGIERVVATPVDDNNNDDDAPMNDNTV